MPTNEKQDDQSSKPLTRRQLLASMGAGAAGLLLASGAGLTGETVYAAAANTNTTGASSIFYNVKDFGARGLGRFDDDDASAIQAAVDAAAPTGGTVYIPPGKYMIDKGIMLRSKVHLLGSGAEASIIKATRPNLPMVMSGAGSSHFTFEGLTFEGLGTPSGSTVPVMEKGIFMNEVSYVRINRCVFKYIANGVYISRSEHVSVTDCSFMFILGSEGPYEGYGVVIEGGANHTVIGNHFKNVYRNCIYLTSGSAYCIVANNMMETCQDSAILLSSKLTACTHHLIEGNMVSASGLSETASSCTYGIRLKDACSFNTIVNNAITRPSSAGIQMEAADNAGDDRPYGNTITGNTIDATVRGIAVLNGDGNAVKSNFIRKAETGILIDTIGEGSGSSAKGNVVTSNSINQCSVAAIKIGSLRCQSNTVFGNAGSNNSENFKDSGTETATGGF